MQWAAVEAAASDNGGQASGASAAQHIPDIPCMAPGLDSLALVVPSCTKVIAARFHCIIGKSQERTAMDSRCND